MQDLISRQAAINATWEEPSYTDPLNILTEVRDRIKALPSVQPDVIRCKDCKHRDPEDKKCDCGHDIIWQLPRHDEWYCADAERKTDDKDI